MEKRVLNLPRLRIEKRKERGSERRRSESQLMESQIRQRAEEARERLSSFCWFSKRKRSEARQVNSSKRSLLLQTKEGERIHSPPWEKEQIYRPIWRHFLRLRLEPPYRQANSDDSSPCFFWTLNPFRPSWELKTGIIGDSPVRWLEIFDHPAH